MPVYYYILAALFLLRIAVLIRSYLQRKKNTSVALFAEALRSENSGHLEAAVITYQSALQEAKKIGLDSRLETKILEKLKVLHSAIEYERRFFTPPGSLVRVTKKDL